MVKKRKGRSAAFMRSINPFLKRKKSRSTTRGQTMARKKGFRRRGKSGGSITPLLLGAGVYGAVREPVSSALSPLTSRIPFGTIADEAVLLAANWWLARRGGMLGNFARAGAIIEAARIGVAVSDGSAFARGNSSSSASAPQTVIG